MKIRDILKHKTTGVITLRPDETVRVLAHRLRLERIGAVVVSGDGARLDGIVSERDVVAGLAEHGPDVLGMPVEALMSRSVRTCTPDDTVRSVMEKMTTRRIRHLPVIEGGRVTGIVSIGDVVKNRLEEMELETGVLRDYAATH